LYTFSPTENTFDHIRCEENADKNMFVDRVR
jgi:hypothetical protein